MAEVVVDAEALAKTVTEEALSSSASGQKKLVRWDDLLDNHFSLVAEMLAFFKVSTYGATCLKFDHRVMSAVGHSTPSRGTFG